MIRRHVPLPLPLPLLLPLPPPMSPECKVWDGTAVGMFNATVLLLLLLEVVVLGTETVEVDGICVGVLRAPTELGKGVGIDPIE